MKNNIKEDYCSLDISKLLKDKGFKVLTKTYYMGSGKMYEWDTVLNGNNKAYTKEIYSRPSHNVAIKWIRENFGIHIKIDWFLDENNKIDWDFCIQKIGTYINEVGNSFYLRDYDPENGFMSHEEATEESLLYTLKHLI